MHPDLVGEAVALLAIARSAGGDDVLPDRFASATARDDVVDRQAWPARAAVLAGPAVPGQDRLARDAAPVDVSRDPHEADQADHLRPVDAHRLGAENVVATLEHLGLLLQDEDQRPAHRADVEWLVARVQDQHPPPGQAAGGGYRYFAVDLPVLGGIVAVQKGSLMAIDADAGVAVLRF